MFRIEAQKKKVLMITGVYYEHIQKKTKLSYSPEHVLHILIIVIVVEKLTPMYTEFLLQTKIKQQHS